MLIPASVALPFHSRQRRRSAAEIVGQMFPVDSGAAHETLRCHTFKVAERLSTPAAAEPATPSEAIVVTLESTFIRSCEAGERHVEVRIGNVETATGRQAGVQCGGEDRHGSRRTDPPQPQYCRTH